MATLLEPYSAGESAGAGPAGFISSIQDLLNAQAHAPDGPWFSDDGSSDIDEDDSHDDTDENVTPSDSTYDLFDAPFTTEPHTYDAENDPEHPSYRSKAKHAPMSPLAQSISASTASDDSAPIRGTSLLQQRPSLTSRRSTGLDLTIQELALDGIDDVDSAIERAQHTSNGDDAASESFDEPRDVDAGMSKEKRLETLVEEFGEWKEGGEEFVMSIPGALYRGVLVKGLVALTNRRMFIYAYIPHVDSNKIIRSGPVTVHFPGSFVRKRRSWIELKGDSVTWFKSSDTLYQPLGACRLSQTKAVRPYDPSNPKCFTIDLIDGRVREFELDTAESCVAWRSDLEAAVFTFRATADKLRLSLPLHLITNVAVSQYMAVAEKVEVQFPSGKCPFDERSISSESDASSMSGPDDDTPQEVVFGYLKTHHDFVVNLEKYVAESKTLGHTICAGTRPILEIDSEQQQSEVETQKEVESEDVGKLAKEFVKTFALHDKPKDLFVSRSTELVRSLPTWGSLCISSRYLCFWRKAKFGFDVKLRIPLTDVDDVAPCKAFGFRIVGLAIQVHGAPDVRLDFHSRKARDAVIAKLKDAVLVVKAAGVAITSPPPSIISMPSDRSVTAVSTTNSTSELTSGATSPTSATAPSYVISPVVTAFSGRQNVVLGQDIEENVSLPAGLAPDSLPRVLGAIGTKKISGLHFFCLTIGSRGDVQPYISLGKELMKDGNRVTIASHPEYRSWVESYGMGYKEVGGDPAALMKLSVEHKMFSPGFFRESLGHFRQWLDNLFKECWEACQEADILIESPSTMAGIHVAEGLGIPYFRAFTMPWTKTSTYPQAFAASVDLGPTYNLLSYTLYDSIIWKATAGQVNRWRKDMLGLKPTNMHKMSQAKTPFIYNFSSAVVPRPNDWRDFINISGYWFLDSEANWEPPAGLLDFIKKARDDEKKIIYIGFGSIVVPDSAAVTKAVVKAVLDSDVRAILSKGWSDRGSVKAEEVQLPAEIFSVPSIAHDKLFPLIDAACHHGGAGTTGASLRAGLPTLIHPFFGDQYFWATRVSKLGAGVKISTLSAAELTSAFKQGTTDRIMREKAQAIGEKIRAENGPRAALLFIYDHIHLAQERADLRARRARNEKKDGTIRRTPTLGGDSCIIGKMRSRSSTPEGARVISPTSPSSPTRSFTLPGVLRSSTVQSTETAATV